MRTMDGRAEGRNVTPIILSEVIMTFSSPTHILPSLKFLSRHVPLSQIDKITVDAYDNSLLVGIYLFIIFFFQQYLRRYHYKIRGD